MARDIRRTGEDHVIEGQRRERLADFRTAGEGRHLSGIKGLSDDFFDDFGSLGCVLRRLDHRSVARGKNARQGLEYHRHREVPGSNNADHTFGLILNM